jgi:hypothetical protein
VSSTPSPAFKERATIRYLSVIGVVELALAAVVFVGVLLAAVHGVRVMAGMDWGLTATFDELIGRVLVILIGLEVIRLLLVHNLRAVLELLAFAIARKMLRADVTAVEIALGAVSFVALLAANRHFLEPARPREPAS